MTDVEYLFLGLGIGLAMRVLIAILDTVVAMFRKEEKENK